MPLIRTHPESGNIRQTGPWQESNLGEICYINHSCSLSLRAEVRTMSQKRQLIRGGFFSYPHTAPSPGKVVLIFLIRKRETNRSRGSRACGTSGTSLSHPPLPSPFPKPGEMSPSSRFQAVIQTPLGLILLCPSSVSPFSSLALASCIYVGRREIKIRSPDIYKAG